MAYQLRTRPPTGRVPWPLILIEGGEKVGKTWACAEFSKCDRIGQMYWLDLAEGSGDEYGAIPGTRYKMVEHDGTWHQIYGAVSAVREIARQEADAGRPPVVLTIDPMTAEWELHKDWAGRRARSSDANRKKLQADPNAEIVISGNYWNDANERHRSLMKLLMTFPGIVLMTARGKEVTAFGDNGQPIPGTKEYRVEGHKNLGFDASCWIRLDRRRPGWVVGVRSVHHRIRPGIDEPQPLARDWTIESVVFDTLRCDPTTAHARDMVEMRADASPLVSAYAVSVDVAIDEISTNSTGYAEASETLRSWWLRVAEALRSGELTQPEADYLGDKIKAVKSELEASQTTIRTARTAVPA